MNNKLNVVVGAVAVIDAAVSSENFEDEKSLTDLKQMIGRISPSSDNFMPKN